MDTARQGMDLRPAKLELESYCICTYQNLDRTTEICSFIQNWKKQNTVFINNGKVEYIPELLNYSGGK